MKTGSKRGPAYLVTEPEQQGYEGYGPRHFVLCDEGGGLYEEDVLIGLLQGMGLSPPQVEAAVQFGISYSFYVRMQELFQGLVCDHLRNGGGS